MLARASRHRAVQGDNIITKLVVRAEAAQIKVEVTPAADGSGLDVVARVKTTGPTGVEMEALTAVSVACLTLYDMLKAADKAMTIEAVRLVEKTGGASGDYHRADP